SKRKRKRRATPIRRRSARRGAGPSRPRSNRRARIISPRITIRAIWPRTRRAIAASAGRAWSAPSAWASEPRMDRAGVGKVCLAMPGATMDHPFGPGHDAYKVGGKMFALIGAEGGLSFKVSDIAYEVLTEE